MLVKFNGNLGRQDIESCNKAFNCKLRAEDCTDGSVAELPDEVAAKLGKKYPALFSAVDKVKGVAKEAAVTGVKQ